MIDHAAVADRLFGGSMRTTEAAPQPQPQPQQSEKTPEQSLAERLYSGHKDDYVSPFAQPQKPQQAQQGEDDQQKARQGQQPPEQLTAQATELAGHLASEVGLAADHPETTAFTTLAAKIGLSKESAIALAKFDAERNAKAWDDTAATWLSEAKADAMFDVDVEYGRTVLREFASPELMNNFIEGMRLGNNTEVIKFLGSIGRALERNRR